MTTERNMNVRCLKENTEPKHQHFIDKLPLEMKSRVAIVPGKSYSKAEKMVRESLDLLEIKELCKKQDNVLVKPNLAMATPPEIAEDTHPNIVAAVVKICKESGATVKVGDSCVWWESGDTVLEVSGVEKAALDAGADEVLDFAQTERVEVEVPGGRVMRTALIPKPVVDADVIINLPKLKNNFVTLTTLSMKNMLGLLQMSDRHIYHRTPWDMAWAVNDLFKIIKEKHRLTLIDGIIGVDGATHAGFVCNPGVIVASEDPIAAEAIANTIVGYNPIESPHVQVGMKDGLGTGELAEIDIVGSRLQDVIYPFQRPMLRFVSEHMNVIEYYGGTCHGCIMAAVSVPTDADPEKKYAVISGSRVLIANELDEFDEVWLVGKCACTASDQFPGFMDKVKAAKKTVRMPTCPGWTHIVEENMMVGRPIEIPDVYRPEYLEERDSL